MIWRQRIILTGFSSFCLLASAAFSCKIFVVVQKIQVPVTSAAAYRIKMPAPRRVP
jgi:hypothetical protein